jgi:2',3'-cyclic-nucleotide 2'-phosphodiesterase (5'-nucleotidase family)
MRTFTLPRLFSVSSFFFPLGFQPAARLPKCKSGDDRLWHFTRESTWVDSVMLKKIRPYKDSVDADMNVELATSADVMEKGQPESTLGNFVSDVCLDTVRGLYHPEDKHPVDFAFFNNGGLRNSLPRGLLRKRDVYELMPFENELVILTLNGATVQKFLTSSFLREACLLPASA